MDRRTKKTKQAIVSSYLMLRQKKEIDRISITEIADLADIGRGTFYTHYKDIYDLEESIIDDFISELSSIIKTSYKKEEDIDIYVQAISNIIEFLDQERQFCQIMINSSFSRYFPQELNKQITDLIINLESKNKLPTVDLIELLIYVSGWITVLIKWIQGEINVGKKQLIELVQVIYFKDATSSES